MLPRKTMTHCKAGPVETDTPAVHMMLVGEAFPWVEMCGKQGCTVALGVTTARDETPCWLLSNQGTRGLFYLNVY